MTDEDKQVDLLPCPFCGSKIDTEECPYPSGTTWQYCTDGLKKYGGHRQFENQCLNIVCQCGAVLEGDTKDELITLWNTRPRAGRAR